MPKNHPPSGGLAYATGQNQPYKRARKVIRLSGKMPSRKTGRMVHCEGLLEGDVSATRLIYRVANRPKTTQNRFLEITYAYARKTLTTYGVETLNVRPANTPVYLVKEKI
jgi:hypothetical protein